MKQIVTILLIFAVSGALSAQWSIGARFGGGSGLSLKHYGNTIKKSAFETVVGWSLDEEIEGVFVTPTWQKMGYLSSTGNFSAIFGPGVTGIFGDKFKFGATAVLGLDWRVTRRIGFQIDWMPSYIFVNESYFSPLNAGITARWLFGRDR